ncbi:MAG TPA: Hpt domain-containing protein [Longimicrobiales bacterium]
MTAEAVLSADALERLRRIGGTKLLLDMIALYLDSGPGRIRALLDGAEAGDASRVERAAHSLKSSAGNLGALRLLDAVRALEARAADGGVDRDLVMRVVREYDASEDALRRVLEEQGE